MNVTLIILAIIMLIYGIFLSVIELKNSSSFSSVDRQWMRIFIIISFIGFIIGALYVVYLIYKIAVPVAVATA